MIEAENNKQLRHEIIWATASIPGALCFHLLMKQNNLKGDMASLIVLPVIFSAIYLLRAVKAETRLTKMLLIFVSLSLLNLVLKVQYRYYNVFLNVFMVLSFVWFVFNYYGRLKKHTVVLAFMSLGLATLALVMPDKWISFYRYDGLRFSGEVLSWNDFKGAPTEGNYPIARIRTNLFHEYNEVGSYPPAFVYSYMEPHRSWVRDLSDHPSYSLLLAHEQAHFYIAEYCARRCNDSLRTVWLDRTKVDRIISTYYDSMHYLQRQYDEQTNHGVHVAKQFEWTKLMKKVLFIESKSGDIENGAVE